MNDLELSGSLEAERRAHLIQLDLGVQYLTIDNPMPTWSKRYLIDPESGKPVKLVITEHDGRSVKYRLTGMGSTVIQEFGFFKPLK